MNINAKIIRDITNISKNIQKDQNGNYKDFYDWLESDIMHSAINRNNSITYTFSFRESVYNDFYYFLLKKDEELRQAGFNVQCFRDFNKHSYSITISWN